MTWTHNGNAWERRCYHCHGTGKETRVEDGRSYCGCPWEHSEDIDHPVNTPTSDHRWIGIAQKLRRCDKCSRVWLVYFEVGDDSWDVPAPECVGLSMPPLDWRPEPEKKT